MFFQTVNQATPMILYLRWAFCVHSRTPGHRGVSDKGGVNGVWPLVQVSLGNIDNLGIKAVLCFML